MPQWVDDRVEVLVSDLNVREIQNYCVIITENGPGFYAVVGNFADERSSVCLHAAASCLDILARGRRTLIRNPPEEERFRDFEKDAEFWKSYVRFVFDEEGDWSSVITSTKTPPGVRYLSFGSIPSGLERIDTP